MNENLIDRYLLNLLTPEEKSSFEIQLEEDESLKEEMLLQKEVLNQIEGYGRIQLKSQLKEIHKDVVENSKSATSSIRFIIYKLAIASSFIGLVSFGWWWMQQSPSNAILYSQNFEPFELSLNERSSENNIYLEVESLYNDRDYDKAIPLFKESLDNSKFRSSQILLGLGISYLQTDQPNNAIIQFKEIIEKKDFNYEDEAIWYLGLSYLKLDDQLNANNYLEILASDTGRDHHEAAKKILSQIAD